MCGLAGSWKKGPQFNDHLCLNLSSVFLSVTYRWLDIHKNSVIVLLSDFFFFLLLDFKFTSASELNIPVIETH
uniref:Uncharacterized protein n=1 Tax=Octopus bimaculoides TaxID=37653 RepID=A0A0L8G037_OCTBM